MTTRFTVTLDTGAYIPVTPNKDTIGYITISWRTVIAPMVFENSTSCLQPKVTKSKCTIWIGFLTAHPQ